MTPTPPPSHSFPPHSRPAHPIAHPCAKNCLAMRCAFLRNGAHRKTPDASVYSAAFTARVGMATSSVRRIMECLTADRIIDHPKAPAASRPPSSANGS